MRRHLLLSAVPIVVAAACSGSSSHGSSKDPAATPVTVFAAASLTEAFGDARGAIETAHTGMRITFSFSGSGALVQQLQQGAPADVIATADEASMQKLVDAGLVEKPRTFARNKLEILVAHGNPKGIQSLADLARPDITFVTEDDSVPAGRYAAVALTAADVVARPASMEPNVKAAVQKVVIGEADATIVYVTDVQAAGAKADGVRIPDSVNQTASYPIAVVRSSAHRAAAEAFVEAIVSGSGQSALKARGFLTTG